MLKHPYGKTLTKRQTVLAHRFFHQGHNERWRPLVPSSTSCRGARTSMFLLRHCKKARKSLFEFCYLRFWKITHVVLTHILGDTTVRPLLVRKHMNCQSPLIEP